MTSQVELLSPAGDFEKLQSAFHYGADAVYLGGKAFNLRARSSNFNLEGLKRSVDYAHGLGKKCYITLNILAHEKEIKVLPKFVSYLESIRVDAVIVSDLGILDLVKEHSNLEVHVSTQSSVTNARAAKVWRDLGAKRIILAREVSLREIKSIKDQLPDLDIEVFVHGAMCMAYSGRCQISHYMSERDSNRGSCANACRWKYSVVEEKRPGEYFPVYEDETGSYLYNSKDLCTVEFLDKIIDAGVMSLKIEGRMKSALYNATVTRVYRDAIDSWKTGNFEVNPYWMKELESFSHRGYTPGFFLPQSKKGDHNNRNGGYAASHEFVGYIEDISSEGIATIALRGGVEAGESVEVLRKGLDVDVFEMPRMQLIPSLKDVTKAHSGTVIQTHLPMKVEPGEVIRKVTAP